MAKTLTICRKGYYRKDGTYVKGSTYEIKDRGQPGRTPEKKKWFAPQVEMNWTKDMLLRERRENALMAHKGDYLSTARALQALANVTTDRETEYQARKDAKYFFRLYRERGN